MPRNQNGKPLHKWRQFNMDCDFLSIESDFVV
jgi:hypothetical protein